MTALHSFGQPIDALIVGATGGLGRAFTDALIADASVRTVHAWSRSPTGTQHNKLTVREFDISDQDQLRTAADTVDRLSLVIVSTGLLHNGDGSLPERSWKSLDPAHMAENFRVNTILPAIIAKHTVPLLPRRERCVFAVLSARVGSISDNRLGGWYSYRASKAALNQIVACLGIELRRTHPQSVCVGLHPGTVDTQLSRPFQKSLAENHKLYEPSEAASNLLRVIDGTPPKHSGSLLSWDGSVLSALTSPVRFG